MKTAGKNDEVRNDALGESVISFGQSRKAGISADDGGDAIADKEGVIFAPH
jgi:hypothetical protein